MARARWRWLTIGLVALTLGGCTTSPTGPSAPLDQSFTLAPGERRRIDGAGIEVQFDRVEGDSRCPADAFCILGGDAIVKVTVVDEGRSHGYDLHTGSMAPVRHDGHTVTLLELAPYPFSARPIAPDDYRATLKVSR